MILFLFGTWGAGKSFVGNLIEAECGLPHLVADLHFTFDLVEALRQKVFHEAELEPFYRRVIVEMDSYKRRFDDFVVSQGIYDDNFRHMIYERFAPDIHFVLINTPDKDLQKERLSFRTGGGNPITVGVFEEMQAHWQQPTIPFTLIQNDETLKDTLPQLMREVGLCYHMLPEDWAEVIDQASTRPNSFGPQDL